MTSLIDVQEVLRASYGDSSARTASVGGSGTWAMDCDPDRKGFPEELACAGEGTVVETFQEVDTPFGPIPQAKVIDVSGAPVVRVPVHGWRLPYSNLDQTLATYWLLHKAGVQQVVVDASVGGIRAKPWDLVVPDDVTINDPAKLAVTRLARELGFDSHVRMAEPFCARVREALVRSITRLKDEPEGVSGNVGNLVDGGIYHTTPLSVFETHAEIDFLRDVIGATVVGQSSGQEAAAARICGMCLAVVNPVVNYAEGLEGGAWTPGGVKAFYDQCALPVALVTYWALEALVASERDCGCSAYTQRRDRPKFISLGVRSHS